MTELTKPLYIPTMDEAYRFIASNPLIAVSILVETQNLSQDGSDASNGRLRELWKLAGGSVDKKGRAWIELHLLPGLIRTVAALSQSNAAVERDERIMRSYRNAVNGLAE